MNKRTRRIHELKTGRVKQKRLSLYPYDENLREKARFKPYSIKQAEDLKCIQLSKPAQYLSFYSRLCLRIRRIIATLLKQSKATLNRWLRVIEDAGYIVRRRRIKKHPVYGTVFKSTLYFMTLKGCHLLKKMGVPCRDLFNKILNKLKGHFPSMKSAFKKKKDPGPGLEKLNAIAGGLVAKFIE